MKPLQHMNHTFRYADLHCHPNLKTFGHSFDRRISPKSDVWHTVPATPYRRRVQGITGITKFSQTDLSTMTRAGARIALVSLYPFEKGFFFNRYVPAPLAAWLANWGIEIGYERVRYLQQHTDYFTDLLNEYRFLRHSPKATYLDGAQAQWLLTRNWAEVEAITAQPDSIAVVLTIEGAHVFNCGLGDYGVAPNEEEILSNIEAVKGWDHVPLFIGLAHNFNNDLCGHARSLQRLGGLVNQEQNIDTGISALGYKAIQALLSEENGRPIYIDLKHMSLAGRQQYYGLLKTDYANKRIPIVVSHGSVTGRSIGADTCSTTCTDIFNTGNLNFFDEEIVEVVRSGGLFAIQMDRAVNTDALKLKSFLQAHKGEPPIRTSARIIWNQLQHIAEVCDRAGLYAWGSTAVGSDFDGSICPFPGVLTAAGLEPLAQELAPLASAFLSSHPFSLFENRNITPEEVIDRFMYSNTVTFLRQFYNHQPAYQQPSILTASP